MAGALGATVFTVTLKADDALLMSPDESISVAVKLCAPFVNAAVVKFQAPLMLAVVVPSSVAPSNILTVLFPAPIPVSVSTLALVMALPTVPLFGENDVITGAECLKSSAITGLIWPFIGAIFKLSEDELVMYESHHDGSVG